MPLSQEQFERAVMDYGPTLRRILLRLTRGRGPDADDLLQRTFQKAWEKRDTFIDGSEVEPWLRGIARYEHLNLLRRKGQRHRLATKVMNEVETRSVQMLPSLAEDHSPLRACMERLNAGDQRIVGLFYGRNHIGEQGATDETALEPMSDREVAGLLDDESDDEWSPDRVRTRRHRAIKALRKCLKSKGAMT